METVPVISLSAGDTFLSDGGGTLTVAAVGPDGAGGYLVETEEGTSYTFPANATVEADIQPRKPS